MNFEIIIVLAVVAFAVAIVTALDYAAYRFNLWADDDENLSKIEQLIEN